jgi:hypothetical protein
MMCSSRFVITGYSAEVLWDERNREIKGKRKKSREEEKKIKERKYNARRQEEK